jgi:hypothetical protein
MMTESELTPGTRVVHRYYGPASVADRLVSDRVLPLWEFGQVAVVLDSSDSSYVTYVYPKNLTPEPEEP